MIQSAPAVVLDVGCFCGASGEWLKKKYPQARVVGIEPSAKAAAEARKRLDAVLQGRLEEVDLSQADVGPRSVDVIVLADVLEHMYDPWRALGMLRPLLRGEGVILASIPNIRNWAIMEQLAQGDFPYAESGLLDITHIRFFTRQGVQRMFEETGFTIEAMTATPDPRCESILGSLQCSPPVTLDTPSMQIKNQTHEQLSELATLQYWLRARPV
jgi:trans-aconitate methyltransferase